MSHVYKILPRTEWIAAQHAGRFAGSTIDLRDGYIHLSTAEQAAETARLHFRGQDDLVLLRLPAERLSEQLKWEPSRGGQLFPHLYRALDPGDVVSVKLLELNAQGWPDPGRLEA